MDVAMDHEGKPDLRLAGDSFSQSVVDEGHADALGVARTLAEKHHLPLVDLGAVGVDAEAVKMIALPVLNRVVAIPFASDGSRLKVAITDPQDVRGLDELRIATRLSVEFHVAARSDVLAELRRLSRAAGAMNASFAEEMAGAEEEEEDVDDLEADDGISDAPLVRLVNSMIFEAAEDAASDIHVEPQEDDLVVRYRIDGVLHVAHHISKRLASGVTTRLKVLAKLDIAERRRPQDGRISLNAAAAGRMLDIRVATLPTVDGEAVTMRLLDKSRDVPTLGSLGLSDRMSEQMDAILARPTGALLVTGPTGSGKSTTLYAALNAISRPEINIITVEDPVEYRLAGVNQVQINPRAGLSFATALRSIIRSDPDVIMVGEIRDGETARISIEAALTGHFVLSTLHTNDAPSAITRLTEMGVEPFLTGAAVSAVLAQRLARRLCPHCAEQYLPTFEELHGLHLSEDMAAALDGVAFRRRRGCARCGQTGYRGRVGVFQLLSMSDRLEQLAAEKAPREEIERAALEEGMRTMWEDGVGKVTAGITSVEELARVCTV
jgi:type IV pilus assembly protein PilB